MITAWNTLLSRMSVAPDTGIRCMSLEMREWHGFEGDSPKLEDH